MPLIRSLTSLFFFLILVYGRNLWFPVVAGIVSLMTSAWVAWFIGTRVTRHFILQKILPRVDPKGKAVLITGCNTGFGHSLALEVNRLGFLTFACVRSDSSPGAKALKSKCKNPELMRLVLMDVTRAEDVTRGVEEVKKILSTTDCILHAVVNNAGILSCGQIEWSRGDDVSDYQEVLDVNLLGLIRVTRSFLPLIRSAGGRVVNMTSTMARTNVSSMNAYCVSKSAAVKFTDGLQQEVAGFGVTAVTVEPWFFVTPLLTTEHVRDSMEKAWNRAPVDVKDAHGVDFYQKSTNDLVFMCTDKRNVYQDASPVTEDLVDALTSIEPALNYRTIGNDARGVLYYLVNEVLPFDLVPLSRRLLAKILIPSK